MDITVRATALAAASIETTFELVTDSPAFPEYFPGNLVIAAVTRVERLDEPTQAGSRRRVQTADGAELIEVVDVLDPPREHSYRIVEGFKPPANFLFREARAQWLLRTEGGGTRIDWTYAYSLTHPLAALIAWPVIGIFFRAAMRDCLDRMALKLSR